MEILYEYFENTATEFKKYSKNLKSSYGISNESNCTEENDEWKEMEDENDELIDRFNRLKPVVSDFEESKFEEFDEPEFDEFEEPEFEEFDELEFDEFEEPDIEEFYEPEFEILKYQMNLKNLIKTQMNYL